MNYTGQEAEKKISKPMHIIILTMLLIFGASVFPQTATLRFDPLSLEEGISHNMIFCIHQDRQGFMWFGTMYGLIKYDGLEYKVYRHDPTDPTSISHDDIISIHEDQSGNLWVGTWGGGLNKMDLQTESFTRYLPDPDNPRSISDDTVWDIEEVSDENGTSLWIATQKGGLDRLENYVYHDQTLKNEPPQTRSQKTDTVPGFVHYQHDPDDPHSLSSNYVRCLYEDRSGNLWIGTARGLSKLTPADQARDELGHANSFQLLKGEFILSIYEDGNRNLWIGTSSSGLTFISKEDRHRGDITRRFKSNPSDPHSLANNSVNFIHQDQQGVYWVGTSGGLSRLEGDDLYRQVKFNNYYHDPDDRHSLSSNSVHTLFEDRAGILWFGTYHGGVDKLVRRKVKFVHYQRVVSNENSLSGDKITAIYEDSEGSLWLGTARNGLNQLPAVQQKKNTSANQASQNPLFAGTAELQYRHFKANDRDSNSIPGNKISAIIEAGENRDVTSKHDKKVNSSTELWIGTRGSGLVRMRRSHSSDGFKFKHYQNNPRDAWSLSSNIVTTVIEDHLGNIWVGTINGLNKLDIENEQFTRYRHDPSDAQSLCHSWVLSLYEDKSGTIWVGTYGGLSQFNREEKIFVSYRHDMDDPSSLSNNYVYAIYEDWGGTLWVGTSNGLNKFNPTTKTFTAFKEKDGLPNSVICGIIEDDKGRLWISTHKGLSRFDPSAPRNEMFKNYDIADGLQSNIFIPGASFKNKQGEMFFGGIKGFNQFDPDEMAHNTYVPPIVITEVTAFDTPVKIDRSNDNTHKLELAQDDDWITIEYAALDYTAPQKNQYAYQLEGVDENWIYCGNQHAVTYTNLSPGEYVFRVKGSNNDGKWNGAGTELALIIHPPFWQTAWFYALSAMFLVLFAVGIHYAQMRRKVRQSLAIERARMRERELVREKTARDYHDELGHQLTKISLYSELLRRDLGNIENIESQDLEFSQVNGQFAMMNALQSPKFSNYLNKITTASQHLCNDTRDFIWALNPEKDSLYELGLYLQHFGEEFFEDAGIDFEMHGLSTDMDKIRLSMDWRRHLIFIFKEAMTNVIKHSGARKVIFEVRIVGKNLLVSLSDEGRGLPPTIKDDGSGLQNMKKRAKILNGEVGIISHPEQGTIIRFSGQLPEIENG